MSQLQLKYRAPPRRWLWDRIEGKSKYGDRERPFGPCCWVPPPVGWCPGCCEDNGVCRTCGFLGYCSSETSRFWCMHIGFICNLCSFCLMVYTCFAISENFDFITRSSFGRQILTEVNGAWERQEVVIDIGLRAISLYNPIAGTGELVIRFDQFCALANDGLQRYMDPADCAACNDISMNLVISSIIAVISFVPTFFTDILRMYSGYDVNCQKCFGTCFSFATVLLAVNVLVTFKIGCLDSFYGDNNVFLDASGNRIPDGQPLDNAELQINYALGGGWGSLFMLVALVLKFIEVVCHFCIRTPTVTRDGKEQRIYENINLENFP